MLRHSAACCGMLQNPHVQLQKKGAAACCGCTSLVRGAWLPHDSPSQNSFPAAMAPFDGGFQPPVVLSQRNFLIGRRPGTKFGLILQKGPGGQRGGGGVPPQPPHPSPSGAELLKGALPAASSPASARKLYLLPVADREVWSGSCNALPSVTGQQRAVGAGVVLVVSLLPRAPECRRFLMVLCSA